MGVMGSGKSAVGRALAGRLACTFLEGDDFHSAHSVEKMRSGAPLDDEDRMPWLDRIADWISTQAVRGLGGVVACSALRKAYRDRLRLAVPRPLPFVVLHPREEILRARVAARDAHFMAPSLLQSQLNTLELPKSAERAIVLANETSIDETCTAIIEWLELSGSHY